MYDEEYGDLIEGMCEDLEQYIMNINPNTAYYRLEQMKIFIEFLQCLIENEILVEGGELDNDFM